ncbi:MAG TPA: NAD-dependent epimerase/dehydratase family protein [Gaiellaceae bacterium]|nr:NAD-dependent epimerase/dehydratase family protein [Gaiellaceae bacterium]
MRYLILGGTAFLGRAAAEEALARGHDVTLFTRGRTNPGLFPEAEHLVGDRADDLRALAGRSWDAVLDTSGYVPAHVRASAEALREAEHYTFVSSISVYADFTVGPSEESALAELGDAPADRVADDYSNYGSLKALCESETRRVFDERALVVRPGLIVGPHDPTGRFTYWARRLARGGEILAPGPPERRVQFVDVRDLAAWLVDGAERRLAGTFNATHPGIAWGALLADADVTWVDDAFLLEHGVGPWMELPLWLPAEGTHPGMHQADVARAVGAGLRFRPLAETIAGAAEAPETEAAGLSPAREAELLAAWRARV